jgi:hypothetical protein
MQSGKHNERYISALAIRGNRQLPKLVWGIINIAVWVAMCMLPPEEGYPNTEPMGKRKRQRKELKRILKNPDKAKCKLCKSKMVYGWKLGKDNEKEEYFKCLGNSCGRTIPITREPRSEKKKKKREAVASVEPTQTPEATKGRKMPKIDEANLEVEYIYKRIGDREYEVDRRTLPNTNEVMVAFYNPIKGILRVGDLTRSVTANEHDKFMGVIRLTI